MYKIGRDAQDTLTFLIVNSKQTLGGGLLLPDLNIRGVQV